MTVKNEHHFDVVSDVSFSVRGGEIFAIAGVSGNGQTEIADAITGMLKIASGRVKLAGRDITSRSIRERRMTVFPIFRRTGRAPAPSWILPLGQSGAEGLQGPFSKKGISI